MATGKEQVNTVLAQACMVKNESSRVGGFSPAQWVLGRGTRELGNLDDNSFADLGALESRHDPESIFALQHAARIEARKAYVHLDCSRRAFPREWQVGDLVSFRRDNQRGGTQWSPTCHVIGHEGTRNVWVLNGNVPALVSSHSLRVASPSEALAVAILNGEPVFPQDVVSEGQQQSFLDARVDRNDESEEYPSPSQAPAESRLTPVPEDDEDIWARPDIFDDEIHDEEEDAGVDPEEPNEVESSSAPAATRTRAHASANASPGRNVRQRIETREPESERGSSLDHSRRASASSTSAPSAWPNIHASLDDLPQQLREHFARARENEQQAPNEEREEATALFSAFFAGEEEIEQKKVQKRIIYEQADPETQKGLQDAEQNGQSLRSSEPCIRSQKHKPWSWLSRDTRLFRLNG